MLTSLTLKDYTTFIGETTFDFKATNYKILEDTNVGSNRILKGALFVGENASGKTQVLKAIKLLLDVLLDNSEQNIASKKSLYTKGTKYSMIFTFNVLNKVIKYEIVFNNNNIYSEKLYVNNILKLNRLKENGETNFGSETNSVEVNPNLSLLKLEYYNTKFNNDKTLNEWFDFLKKSVYIDCEQKRIKVYSPNNLSKQFIGEYAKKNEPTFLNNLFDKLGYNSEIIFNKEKNNILANSYEELISLRKKGTDVDIPLKFESTGNKAFINAIMPICFSTSNNCMVLVDEFSSGLHNELEEALIRYFFNNSKNSQMFFTTHSTNLLDNTIIRPDQIYSFKFDAKKGTLIKRFSEENPRESQNIEKMYLNGVFDGMPSYNKEFKD